jgi:hypothetical protein
MVVMLEQVPQVPLVFKGLLVHQDLHRPSVQLEPQDLREELVPPDDQDLTDFRDPKVQLEFKVSKDHKEPRDLEDPQVKWVQLELPEPPEPEVPEDNKVRQDLEDSLVFKDLLELVVESD